MVTSLTQVLAAISSDIRNDSVLSGEFRLSMKKIVVFADWPRAKSRDSKLRNAPPGGRVVIVQSRSRSENTLSFLSEGNLASDEYEPEDMEGSSNSSSDRKPGRSTTTKAGLRKECLIKIRPIFGQIV